MLSEQEPQASVSTAFSSSSKLSRIIFACAIITSTARASSVFLSSFSINLLAFYHKHRVLIGYATHYLFNK